MKERLFAVLLLCIVLLFAVLAFVQIDTLNKIADAVEKTAVRNSVLDDALIRYLDGQIEYYEYSLNGLKAYDAERDYVYDYEGWCKEEFELSW